MSIFNLRLAHLLSDSNKNVLNAYPTCYIMWVPLNLWTSVCANNDNRNKWGCSNLNFSYGLPDLIFQFSGAQEKGHNLFFEVASRCIFMGNYTTGHHAVRRGLCRILRSWLQSLMSLKVKFTSNCYLWAKSVKITKVCLQSHCCVMLLCTEKEMFGITRL